MVKQVNRVSPLRTVTEVVQAVQFTGSHFFSKDTMRFFGSRYYQDVYPTKFGTFFITSEKDSGPYAAWESKRRYTVRFVAARRVRSAYWRHNVSVSKRGQLVDIMPDDFGAFGSLNAARRHASKERDRLNGLLVKDNPVLFDSSKEYNAP